MPLLGADDATSSDQKALQGTWNATAVVDGGTPEYADRVAAIQLKIHDDHYTYDLGDHSFTATFTLNPSRTPKEMDITFWEGPQTGKVMRAIYSLKGDTLQICAAPYARPTLFTSTFEQQSILFTFERDLPSKDITGAEILSFGIYRGESFTDMTGKTNAGNAVESVAQQLLERTQIIPARLGTRFGYEFIVHGAPKGKQVKLRMVFLTPPITDEITGKTTSEDGAELKIGLEESKDVGVYIRLDKKSDLVPGTWAIQIFDHDKKLLEKAFTMVRP